MLVIEIKKKTIESTCLQCCNVAMPLIFNSNGINLKSIAYGDKFGNIFHLHYPGFFCINKSRLDGFFFLRELSTYKIIMAKSIAHNTNQPETPISSQRQDLYWSRVNLSVIQNLTCIVVFVIFLNDNSSIFSCKNFIQLYSSLTISKPAYF